MLFCFWFTVCCGFCASTGDWVHPISDLTTASGAAGISLGKGELLQVPHSFPQVTFQWMHFPPWSIHITLFFWGRFPRMWATAWVGSCPILMAPDLGGMTQLVHSLQVKRTMERASIWGKGLLCPPQQRNIWLWFQIIYILITLAFIYIFIYLFFTIKSDPCDNQQSQNTKRYWRNDKLFSKKNLCNTSEFRVGPTPPPNLLLLFGQRLTLTPDPFLRSVSNVDPEAEFNRPWLAFFWLEPFCTLALHLGPFSFLEKPYQGQPPTTWLLGVMQHSSTYTMTRQWLTDVPIKPLQGWNYDSLPFLQ